MQEGRLFEISDLTLSEAYYSLQASYGVPKPDAPTLIRKISEARGFVVSSHAKDVLAMPNLSKISPGFVSRLIHGEYFAGSKTTVDCEKPFRKLPFAEVFAVKDKASDP